MFMMNGGWESSKRILYSFGFRAKTAAEITLPTHYQTKSIKHPHPGGFFHSQANGNQLQIHWHKGK
jgi:hypothetical protein